MSRSISALYSWPDVHDQKTRLLDDVTICYTAPLSKSESYSVSAPWLRDRLQFLGSRRDRVVPIAVELVPLQSQSREHSSSLTLISVA